MRIGFFTDTYLPEIHGVEVSIESFRRTLEAMGHEVYIYAPETPGYKDANPRVFRFKSQRILKNPEMRYSFDFLPVGHTFGEISRFKLDVVHAHTPFGLGLLAKYISERQLIPLIYTHHTHYQEYAKFYLKEKILLPYLAKVYTTWFSSIAHAIISPSLKIKKLLREYGVKQKVPIYILPTGIDLQIFKKVVGEKQALRKKLKISDQAKILLTVSRIAEEKNVKFLIDSFAKFVKKDVFFLLVGGGPFLEEAKKLVKKLKIEKNIIFIGKVFPEKVSAYYKAADIFLFASLTDTQGIVLLEALACGLPVVALKDDAFSGVILNGKNGFLTNKQNFNKKVTTLLENETMYKKLSAEAVKTASIFSNQNMAKKLVDIYEEQIKRTYNK
ncbi:MAG: glycosyltransferase family 4 protein [bacterium]